MKLNEQEITKSSLDYMFKAARSGQDDVTKDGAPKLNPDGTKKKRAKPLSPEFGERRALRGAPTADNPLGPIIGSGGEMHDPISPQDASKELSRIVGKMKTGQVLPYSQLRDKSDSRDAIVAAGKRSAPPTKKGPGRQAKWPSGARWDKGSKLYGKNRIVISPDGTRKVTKSRPLKPKETKPKQVLPKLLSPEENKAFKEKMRRKAARAEKSLRIQKSLRKKVYKKRNFKSGKFYLSGTIDENFGKSLDKALGL